MAVRKRAIPPHRLGRRSILVWSAPFNNGVSMATQGNSLNYLKYIIITRIQG